MKREAFLWLLSSAAGAAPLLEWEQGSTFDYPGLRFKSDNTFKISMFNDLHLGDGDRKGSDEKTIGVMKSVLDKEGDTDLVVINGDLTSCEWLAPQEATLAIDKIITPLIERGLPFATTFGNHDMSKTCNPRDMSQHIWDMGNKNGRQLTWTAWSVFGDPNVVGTSNYYIPVYSNTGGGNPELKMLLWFFDSKGGKQFNTEGPVDDWVNEKVISWFKLTRDSIQKDHGGKVIPSMAFVHIPPGVTRRFQENRLWYPDKEPGLNEEIISHQANSDNGQDIPFMKAMVETDGMMAIFSGHDHSIDWCMKWSATKPIPNNDPATGKDINICFGRHTGYGGYSDWARGGRQILVLEDNLGKDNALKTWIRLEDGSASGAVSLNSTYGSDKYSPVEKKKSDPAFASGQPEVDNTTSARSNKPAAGSRTTSKHYSTTTRKTHSTTNTSKSTKKTPTSRTKAVFKPQITSKAQRSA